MKHPRIKRLTGTAAVFLFLSAPPGLRSQQTPLTEDERNTIDVVGKSRNSVVFITNIQLVRDFFFGAEEKMPRGSGSGFAWDRRGHIVTNYHVIEDGVEFQVTLPDQQQRSAKLVGKDESKDIAVLKLEGDVSGLSPVTPGTSRDLLVGQKTIAIGNPFGFDYTVTKGIVSALGRKITGAGGVSIRDMIQTDASINPGNSGGPLLNIHGEMIGINQFIMTGGGASRGNIGLGFAIPSNLVKRVSTDLIQSGAVVRPFLGISMQDLTDVLKKRYGVEHGVLVESVMEGEAAEKAGLKAGDVVTHVGEKAVDSPHDLLFAVLSYKPGDKVKLTVNRDGAEKVYEVIARQRSGDVDRGPGGQVGTIESLGLRMQPTQDGLVVAAILPNSPASRAEPELQPGDLVILVNGEKVASHEDVTKALKKTKNDVVLLYVQRGDEGKYLVGIPLDKGK